MPHNALILTSMATLLSKIDTDLKDAMRSKNGRVVEILRLLKNSIQNISIGSSDKKEIQDTDIVQVIRKQIKQREDSIAAFLQGNRNDLVEKEKQEIEVMNQYLPQSLSDDELDQIVSNAIQSINAESIKEMGQVMKIVVAEVQGRADNKTISEKIKNQLMK